MSLYTHTLTITVPAALYDIACRIGQALDEDSGGIKSFGPRTLIAEDGTETTPETYSTTTPCTENFYNQVPLLLSNPAMLHAVVAADYEARWADLVPPTLEECESFCGGVVMVLPAEQIPTI